MPTENFAVSLDQNLMTLNGVDYVFTPRKKPRCKPCACINDCVAMFFSLPRLPRVFNMTCGDMFPRNDGALGYWKKWGPEDGNADGQRV